MHPLSDVSDLARLVHNATHLDASSGRCYRFYCASSQNAVLISLRMRIHTCFFFSYSFLFDLVVCVCVSTASCVCFYGRELQLKLAGVRVDDQVGCAPAHQQTVQMPRKLRQEKTHLSLRFCSPAPPEPPKKASPLRSMPATRVTRPCVLKQRHCTKYGIHAHVTSRVSIHICVFV